MAANLWRDGTVVTAMSSPTSTVNPGQAVPEDQLLEVADIVVLVVYLLFVLAVGLWVSAHHCSQLSLGAGMGAWMTGALSRVRRSISSDAAS